MADPSRIAVLALTILPMLAAPSLAGESTAVCGNSTIEAPEQCDDGNTLNWDGCSARCEIRYCMAPPPPDCITAFHGKISVQQNGKEEDPTSNLRLELSYFSEDVTLEDFGDPVFGPARYDLCIYGFVDAPYGQIIVPRGFDVCGKKQKSCWKEKPEGTYVYSDDEIESWGVRKIVLQAGARGEGRISYTAMRTKKSKRMPLMNKALEGDSMVEIRLMTSGGRCFAATLTDVRANTATRFKAREDPIR